MRNAVELARARSRRRKTSAGATMFIVAITLALLAVMGIYGLTATAGDVRGAGHARSRAQASNAAQFAVSTLAEGFNAQNSRELVCKMKWVWRNKYVVGDKKCTSAKAKSAAADPPLDELCYTMTERDIQKLFASSLVPATPFFTADSIDSTHNVAPRDQLRPFVKVEITNPIDLKAPNGAAFTQLTVTVLVYIAMPNGAVPGEGLPPYDEVFKARGFLTVPALGASDAPATCQSE